MWKLLFVVSTLVLCANAVDEPEPNFSNNGNDLLKRLQNEGKFPKLPDFPKNLFPEGFPNFPAFDPILTEEEIKKLHPTSENENVQAHLETYSSAVEYVDGKKVTDKEAGTVLDNDNGKLTEKHYGN